MTVGLQDLGGPSLTLNSARFRQLVVVAVIMGFLAVLAAAFVTVRAVMQDQALTSWVERSNAIQVDLARLSSAVEQGEAARRGYILTLDPQGRETYERAKAEALDHLAQLNRLTRDNAVQQQRLKGVGEAVQGLFGNQKWSVEMAAKGEQAAAIKLFREDSGESIRNVRSQIEALIDIEQKLLLGREIAQHAAVATLYSTLWIAGPLLVLVALGSSAVIFRYTRDLSHSGEVLRKLNAGLETAVAERTEDLARANEEIQRFAYIVSHDLRSPLVNVMGFTAELETSLKPLNAMIDRLEAEAPQLLNPDVKIAVREDAPEALGFIRKSTQKMDRLINAILQLSRSGRRQLRPETLELSRVLSDVAATLQQRADEAGAEIVVAPNLPTIVSDRLTVEQIFQNLMENAVKYSKPGRPGRIEISGERAGSVAELVVKDNGRGIDPKDHERIFELFRRSGPQDRPGEGIGLAAVRAAVRRLGGAISVDSALDQGAAFRVLLPAALKMGQEVPA